jgi:hypothetical protein
MDFIATASVLSKENDHQPKIGMLSTQKEVIAGSFSLAK